MIRSPEAKELQDWLIKLRDEVKDLCFSTIMLCHPEYTGSSIISGHKIVAVVPGIAPRQNTVE